MKQGPAGRKVVAQNKRARHDYTILETFEAGLSLHGSEVKSVRAGQLSLAEAFIHIRKGEAYLVGAYIKPYEQAGPHQPDATRTRKLLLHKGELATLIGKSQEKSLTIVPLQAYLKRGYVKLEIALGRGRKHHDKRAAIKEREQRREAEKAVAARARR